MLGFVTIAFVVSVTLIGGADADQNTSPNNQQPVQIGLRGVEEAAVAKDGSEGRSSATTQAKEEDQAADDGTWKAQDNLDDGLQPLLESGDTGTEFDEIPVRPDSGFTERDVQSDSAIREPAGSPESPDTFVAGIVTHYGESYEGKPLGCTGRPYHSNDPSIAASAWRPDGSRPYPCGAVLRVSGPAGGLTVVVQDACPGCRWNHLDLSEAGIFRVCGQLGTCAVTIEWLR